jgi:hypothetical protein
LQRAERIVRNSITGARLPVTDDPVTGQQSVTHADGKVEKIEAGHGVWIPESTVVPLTDSSIAKVAQAADVVMQEILNGTRRAKGWIDLRDDERAAWIGGTIELEGPRQALVDVIREHLESVRVDGE